MNAPKPIVPACAPTQLGKAPATPEEQLHHGVEVAQRENQAIETALAAVAGGLVGALAGPIGIAAGALLGGSVGAALAAQTRGAEREEAEHDRDLEEGRIDAIADEEPLPGLTAEELDRELTSREGSG